MKRITSEQARDYPAGSVRQTASGIYAPDDAIEHTEPQWTSEVQALLDTPVAELGEALEGVSEALTVHSAQHADPRKTAAPLYAARIQELTNAEEND